MWYFTWILGVLLACSFGIINGLWFEHTEVNEANGEENSNED
jgi:cyd operon protein YbgT